MTGREETKMMGAIFLPKLFFLKKIIFWISNVKHETDKSYFVFSG